MAVFKGQIGLNIVLETDAESLLAAATTAEIWLKYPSGLRVAFTAAVSGSTLTYTTTSADDLNEVGTYKLQSYVETLGIKMPGEYAKMEVEKPIYSIS